MECCYLIVALEFKLILGVKLYENEVNLWKHQACLWFSSFVSVIYLVTQLPQVPTDQPCVALDMVGAITQSPAAWG